MLQLGDGIGRPHVFFAAHAPGVFAAGIQHVLQHGVVTKRGAVHAQRFFGHFKNTYAAHLAGGATEVLLHHAGFQANGFKKLGPTVRHVGGHAHLGHDLG